LESRDLQRNLSEDKRLFDRFVARFPARFKDSRNDYGTSISLRNASAQGVQITTKERLFIDDKITFWIFRTTVEPASSFPLPLHQVPVTTFFLNTGQAIQGFIGNVFA